MSTIVIRYDGVDITSRVVIKEAEFTAFVNGAPGPFLLKVKDVGFSSAFTSGKEITLDIDGVRHYGGFCTSVKRLHVFPTEVMSRPQRFWLLGGYDYNVLLQKRVLYDHADPSNTGLRSWPVGSHDDVVIKYVFDNYTDLGADGVTYNGVTHIGTPNPDKAGVIGSAGWTMLQALASLNRGISGIYFINADKDLNFVDVDTPSNSIGLSDHPGAGQIGYREFERAMNGSNLVNDQLLWGMGQGAAHAVFSRVQDAPSQALHGRWQAGEVDFNLFRQTSADLRATTFVYGTPQSKRGGKDDQVSWRAVTYQPVFRVGEKVAIESEVFGVSDVVPIRKMKITFPNKTRARFDMILSHEIDQPWDIYEFWFPKIGQIQVDPPRIDTGGGGLPEDEIDPASFCWVPESIDIYDEFNDRTVAPTTAPLGTEWGSKWTLHPTAGIALYSIHDGVAEMSDSYTQQDDKIYARAPLDLGQDLEVEFKFKFSSATPSGDTQTLYLKLIELNNPDINPLCAQIALGQNLTAGVWYRSRVKFIGSISQWKRKTWLDSDVMPTSWTQVGTVGYFNGTHPNTLELNYAARGGFAGSGSVQIEFVAFHEGGHILDCGAGASGSIRYTIQDVIGHNIGATDHRDWIYARNVFVSGPSDTGPTRGGFETEEWLPPGAGVPNYVDINGDPRNDQWPLGGVGSGNLATASYENSEFFNYGNPRENGQGLGCSFMVFPVPAGAYRATFRTDALASFGSSAENLADVGQPSSYPVVFRTGAFPDGHPLRPMDFGSSIASAVASVAPTTTIQIGNFINKFPDKANVVLSPIEFDIPIPANSASLVLWCYFLLGSEPFNSLAAGASDAFVDFEVMPMMASDQASVPVANPLHPNWEGFHLDIYYTTERPVTVIQQTFCEIADQLTSDGLTWGTSRPYADGSTQVYVAGVLQRTDLDYGEISPEAGRIYLLQRPPEGERVTICYIPTGVF